MNKENPVKDNQHKLENGEWIMTRVVNRIKFHFPVSECYKRVDNRIGNIAKIIG